MSLAICVGEIRAVVSRATDSFCVGHARDMQSISTLRLIGLASLASALLLAAADTRADDEHVAPPRRSSAAYSAGFALTVTGAAFLIISLPAAAGTSLALVDGSQPAGGPTLGAIAIGGIVLAGCTVIGLSTLIPGIILMNKNKPVARADDIIRDAHATPPLPPFTYVPLASVSF